MNKKEMNKGIRLINYIIDIVCISVVSNIIGFIFNFINPVIIFYTVFFVYYFVFELYTAQTIGKIITKTIVVDMDNLKPRFRKTLIRTLLRLNPFDPFSYLFGQEQGGHDLISKTRLI